MTLEFEVACAEKLLIIIIIHRLELQHTPYLTQKVLKDTAGTSGSWPCNTVTMLL